MHSPYFSRNPPKCVYQELCRENETLICVQLFSFYYAEYFKVYVVMMIPDIYNPKRCV